VGGALLDASGRPGVNATITVCGSVLGFGLALTLAAVYGTALAAAVGMGVGLVVIGAGTLELSRRLVLRMPWRTLAPALVTPWVALGAAGAAAFGLSRAAKTSPVVTIGLIALAAAVSAAAVAYVGPWTRRLTT
jgi:hypothetical protein